MKTPANATDNNPLRVRRGRVESVDLYEVKDSELDLLERGSPASLQLNFAVFLLSLAFSSIASLCTATFTWAIAQTFFILIAVVGVLMGGYLLLIWWKTRESISAVVKEIRGRIEPPSIPAAVITTPKTEPTSENEPTG